MKSKNRSPTLLSENLKKRMTGNHHRLAGTSLKVKDVKVEYITVNVPLIALTNVPLSQAVN